MRNIRRHTRRASAGLVIALIALLLALGGTAYGKQGQPTKTAATFYNPHDYRPDNSNTGFAAAGIGQRACTSSTSLDGTAAVLLNFRVPDGASITKVTAYYYDTDSAAHLTFLVGFSEPGVSDLLDGFTEVTSSDGSGPPTPQTVELTPTSPVAVDNANRRYFVYARFSACGTTIDNGEGPSPSLLLDGVRVEYALK